MKPNTIWVLLIAFIAASPWIVDYIFRVRYFAFDDGVILVTGTSTGIGRAAAIELSKKGYVVFAGVRKQKDFDEMKTLHENLKPIILDVTNSGHIQEAVQTVTKFCKIKHKPFVGLVNNAGISTMLPVGITPMNKFKQMYEVNVFGVVEITQAFLPLILDNRGRIIQISSTGGSASAPFQGSYFSTKWALEGLTNSLRMELRLYKIPVISIQPGVIDTPIVGKVFQGLNEQVNSLSGKLQKNYRRIIQGCNKLKDGLMKKGNTGSPVSTTTDAILHAIQSEYPQTDYFPGAVSGVPAYWIMKWCNYAPKTFKNWVWDSIIENADSL